MSDTQPGSPRLDAVQCPHCEQVTMPNLLADGSYVCSCPAERALPREDGPGTVDPGMPAPMDQPTAPNNHPGPLPPDRGQFGRDVATEDFRPLAKPPGR
jgi:hypothetical protein